MTKELKKYTATALGQNQHLPRKDCVYTPLLQQKKKPRTATVSCNSSRIAELEVQAFTRPVNLLLNRDIPARKL